MKLDFKQRSRPHAATILPRRAAECLVSLSLAAFLANGPVEMALAVGPASPVFDPRRAILDSEAGIKFDAEMTARMKAKQKEAEERLAARKAAAEAAEAEEQASTDALVAALKAKGAVRIEAETAAKAKKRAAKNNGKK